MKALRDLNNRCLCIDRYYDVEAKVINGTDIDCYICQYNCETCFESASNCTKCRGLNRLQSIPNCLCLDGYFFDPANN